MKRKWKCLAGATAFGSILLVMMGIFGVWQNSSIKKDKAGMKRVNFIAAIANEGYWGRAADGAIQFGNEKNIDVKCLGQTKLGH